MAEAEDAASEEEAADDAPVALYAGKQADKRGDTTESSDVDVDVEGDGDGDDSHAAVSPVPLAATHSDSSAYEDSELKCDVLPLAPSSHG